MGCSAHLLHRGVAIAIVGGFLIFLFLLRFFAFLLHFISSVALLALVTVFVLLLYVDFYLASSSSSGSTSGSSWASGAMESASYSLFGSTETSEWMVFPALDENKVAGERFGVL